MLDSTFYALGMADVVKDMMNLLSYSDGIRSLFEILELLGASFSRLYEVAQSLIEAQLLEARQRDWRAGIVEG